MIGSFEAAVAGAADVIASGDSHLLRLGSWRGIRLAKAARRGSLPEDPASDLVGEPAHRRAGSRDRRASGRGLRTPGRPHEDARQARRYKLADKRSKLLQASYGNAIPLDLLMAEQDRITGVEQMAKSELEATEGDLDGWQDVLRTAIRLAGNCHAAYLKARPSVRRRFNDAVLDAVHVRDRKIARPEFPEVFAPLFSRPSSNKTLKVDLAGRCVNRISLLDALRRQACA